MEGEPANTVTALGESGVAMFSDSGSTPLASTKINNHAGVAQLVEHFTRNEGVAGSSPVSSTNEKPDITGFFRV